MIYDGNFWVWETLEDAIRPHIDDITDHEFDRVLRAFASNYKGSADMHNDLEMRLNRTGGLFDDERPYEKFFDKAGQWA